MGLPCPTSRPTGSKPGLDVLTNVSSMNPKMGQYFGGKCMMWALSLMTNLIKVFSFNWIYVVTMKEEHWFSDVIFATKNGTFDQNLLCACNLGWHQERYQVSLRKGCTKARRSAPLNMGHTIPLSKFLLWKIYNHNWTYRGVPYIRTGTTAELREPSIALLPAGRYRTFFYSWFY